jgi:hypothetical protein
MELTRLEGDFLDASKGEAEEHATIKDVQQPLSVEPLTEAIASGEPQHSVHPATTLSTNPTPTPRPSGDEQRTQSNSNEPMNVSFEYRSLQAFLTDHQ